jgi:hypothetical protein
MKLEIGKRYQSIASRDIRKILFLNGEVVFYKNGGLFGHMKPESFINAHTEYREQATVKNIIEEKIYWIEKDGERVGFLGVSFDGRLIGPDSIWSDEDLKGWWLCEN